MFLETLIGDIGKRKSSCQPLIYNMKNSHFANKAEEMPESIKHAVNSNFSFHMLQSQIFNTKSSRFMREGRREDIKIS